MSMPHLTADGEAIVKLANEIAHEFELEFVGTEHILLAILRHNSGVGAKTLGSFQIDEARARTEIEELLKRAKEDTWVFGRLPGTPHFRNVLALAIDEATQLEAKEVAGEHLLLGLLREKGSAAQRVLARLGVTLEKCRKEILRQTAA